jgi:hypothetical protein
MGMSFNGGGGGGGGGGNNNNNNKPIGTENHNNGNHDHENDVPHVAATLPKLKLRIRDVHISYLGQKVA